MSDFMHRNDQIVWAKEMILVGVDKYLHELVHEGATGVALEDELELIKQRNRVARFLGLPKKETTKL